MIDVVRVLVSLAQAFAGLHALAGLQQYAMAVPRRLWPSCAMWPIV